MKNFFVCVLFIAAAITPWSLFAQQKKNDNHNFYFGVTWQPFAWWYYGGLLGNQHQDEWRYGLEVEGDPYTVTLDPSMIITLEGSYKYKNWIKLAFSLDIPGFKKGIDIMDNPLAKAMGALQVKDWFVIRGTYSDITGNLHWNWDNMRWPGQAADTKIASKFMQFDVLKPIGGLWLGLSYRSYSLPLQREIVFDSYVNGDDDVWTVYDHAVQFDLYGFGFGYDTIMTGALSGEDVSIHPAVPWLWMYMDVWFYWGWAQHSAEFLDMVRTTLPGFDQEKNVMFATDERYILGYQHWFHISKSRLCLAAGYSLDFQAGHGILLNHGFVVKGVMSFR